MSAMVPFEIVSSNRYRNRSVSVIFRIRLRINPRAADRWMVDYIVLVKPGKRIPPTFARGGSRGTQGAGSANTPIISASVGRHDVALTSERFAVPAVPTLLQAQPGDPRHEVELGRPCVSLHDRIQLHARARDGYVALVKHLLRRIVTKHIEPYCVDFDGLRIDMLVVTQPVEEGG